MIWDLGLAILGLNGQIQGERTALIRLAFHVNLTAKFANHLSGNGQAQSGATVLAAGAAVGLLEGFKDHFLLFRRQAYAGISDADGNGLVGTTGPVARVLVDAGYRVVFTDNADRQDYETSRLVAQGAEHQEAAVAVQRLLGSGDVFLEQRQPSGVVDLTIIVGSDLATQG